MVIFPAKISTKDGPTMSCNCSQKVAERIILADRKGGSNQPLRLTMVKRVQQLPAHLVLRETNVQNI